MAVRRVPAGLEGVRYQVLAQMGSDPLKRLQRLGGRVVRVAVPDPHNYSRWAFQKMIKDDKINFK